MLKALVLSIAVHAALFGAARPIAAHLQALTASEPEPVPAPDLWVGTSIEVSTSSSELAGGGETGAAAAAAAPASPSPAEPPPSPAPAAPPASGAPHADRSAAPIAKTPAPRSTATRARKPRPPRAKRPKSTPSATASAAAAPDASASTSAAAPGGDGPAGTFGAEGKASVRDLGRAFTRAIPAACSADPIWSKLAVGDAGTLRVELRVNADGHLASAEPTVENGPRALVNVLRRTVPLLQAGTFAVRGGAVTAGTETLEIKATVSDDGGGDETGGRDNLAFSYAAGRGKASFTQAGGRRVDVSVRVVSVAVAP